MDKVKKLTLNMDDNAQIISLISRGVEITKNIAIIQVAFKQFISKQKKMAALNALLSQDLSELEQNMLIRREELIEITIQVIKILQCFSLDQRKKNLQQRLKCFTSGYIQGCSDSELLKISKKTELISNRYGGILYSNLNNSKYPENTDSSLSILNFGKEYGLNRELIFQLEEAKNRFIRSVHSYHLEKKGREKAAKRIKFLNKQTDKLLATKIDRFIPLFEVENPGFYKDYCRLRENQVLDSDWDTVVPE